MVQDGKKEKTVDKCLKMGRPVYALNSLFTDTVVPPAPPDEVRRRNTGDRDEYETGST